MNKSMLLMIIFFLPSVAMNDHQGTQLSAESCEGQFLGERLKSAGVHEISNLIDRVRHKPAAVVPLAQVLDNYNFSSESRRVKGTCYNRAAKRQEECWQTIMVPSAVRKPTACSVNDSLEKQAEQQKRQDQNTRIKAYAMKVIAEELLRKSDEMLLRASSGSNDNPNDDFESMPSADELSGFPSFELCDCEGIDPALFMTDLS